MNFLDKLNYLTNKNNLNKNTLSKACDIPYTMIDGWYKKGYEGLKLPTLQKLSSYFSTALDYWADDTILDPAQSINKGESLQHSSSNSEDKTLSEFEKGLISKYNKLSVSERKIIDKIIEAMIIKGEVKKENEQNNL